MIEEAATWAAPTARRQNLRFCRPRSPLATWKPKGLPTRVLTKSTPFEKMKFSFFRVASFSCCLRQRPENDIRSGHLGRSSNRQSRFCGLNMKGLRPLHASPNGKNRFVNALGRLWRLGSPKGFQPCCVHAAAADSEGRALRGWRFANSVREPEPRASEAQAGAKR